MQCTNGMRYGTNEYEAMRILTSGVVAVLLEESMIKTSPENQIESRLDTKNGEIEGSMHA
jgi:hypothetical protein